MIRFLITTLVAMFILFITFNWAINLINAASTIKPFLGFALIAVSTVLTFRIYIKQIKQIKW